MRPEGRTKAGSQPANGEVFSSQDTWPDKTTSFELLYRLHSGYVYNACLGMLGNADDARDAMQETFVQLYRSLSKIRRGDVVRTWLYRVAINKSKDLLRRRPSREMELSPELVTDCVSSNSDYLKEQHVRQAILRLKPDYRAVLVLFYFEELSYSEIAETLGCSHDQVRIRLHRARRAFKDIYGSGDDEV